MKKEPTIMVDEWDAANDSARTDAALRAKRAPLHPREFDQARADLLGEVPPQVGHIRTYKGSALILMLCYLALLVAGPAVGDLPLIAKIIYAATGITVVAVAAHLFFSE